MTLEQFAKEIHLIGGKSLLIGGAVIDSILGLEIKDWDIEIYGLSLKKLEAFLSSHHIKCDIVGKSFGVIKCKLDNLEVDLSLPRRENKIGVGHKAFQVELDHTMTPEEAARRRDLTINSMYKDLYTGRLIDPFEGFQDLMDGKIKATNPTTFVEDPLRVLRIMQLLPRKGKFVDPKTLNLCRSLVKTFNFLSKERVFEEFNKLLLKADKPSMGLNFLWNVGWIQHFPELEALIGCEQNPEWHPEGDVWIHTLMVVDNAAKLRNQIPEQDRLPFMYGCLLHDCGKPSTTKEDYTAYGHDKEGVKVARRFMERLTNNIDLIDKVCNLVRYHMSPGHFVGKTKNAKPSAWRRLHNKSNLILLGHLHHADSASSGGRQLEDECPGRDLCFEYHKKLKEISNANGIKALVMGRDLIKLGLTPGPEFGHILSKLYEMQIEENLSKDELLNKIMFT